jgi:hypothetical protein
LIFPAPPAGDLSLGNGERRRGTIHYHDTNPDRKPRVSPAHASQRLQKRLANRVRRICQRRLTPY